MAPTNHFTRSTLKPVILCNRPWSAVFCSHFPTIRTLPTGAQLGSLQQQHGRQLRLRHTRGLQFAQIGAINGITTVPSGQHCHPRKFPRTSPRPCFRNTTELEQLVVFFDESLCSYGRLALQRQLDQPLQNVCHKCDFSQVTLQEYQDKCAMQSTGGGSP